MSDQFDSPKQLISHARDEIKEAELLINSFVKQQRGTRVIHHDVVTSQEVHCVRISGPDLPPKLANVVKDAASNLRDALDHAVYSAAVAITGKTNIRNTGFAFAKDAAGVQGELNGPRLSGNPPEIRPLLASFHPYERGNATLWALNQIRNPNTHRFIVPVGSAAMYNHIGVSNGFVTGGGAVGYSKWDPTNKEIEYMRVGRGSRMNYQVGIALAITFGDIDTVAGKDVIPTLNLMADETERIVSAIETETLRIVAARGK